MLDIMKAVDEQLQVVIDGTMEDNKKETDSETRRYGEGFCAGIELAQRYIRNADVKRIAVDVKPLKSGRWEVIEDYDGVHYRCTGCNAECYLVEGNPEDNSEEIALIQKFSERLNHFEIPTIEAEPIKHGRWSECYTDSHHYSGICSVCGRASIKNLTGSLYEYCPRCGARMDGDDNGTDSKV